MPPLKEINLVNDKAGKVFAWLFSGGEVKVNIGDFEYIIEAMNDDKMFITIESESGEVDFERLSEISDIFGSGLNFVKFVAEHMSDEEVSKIHIKSEILSSAQRSQDGKPHH